MGRLRAINVFMAGEVSVPGAYSVSALTTVTQALFQAGGVTDIGSLRNIQVRRAGLVVATFGYLRPAHERRCVRRYSAPVG